MKPRIAVLGGPTGAGKTQAVVAWRRAGLPIEAINVDALQVYRRLEAGTAKPSDDERAAVPTWLLDVAEPTEAWNAARHAELADAAIAEVASRGAWPVLVGGTGLYVRAILRGLAEIPPVPSEVRTQLAEAWQARGPAALHAELRAVDPDYAAQTPMQNRQRVLRALEVFHATGRAFSDYHRDHQAQGPRYPAALWLLAPSAEALHARIDKRARTMAEPLLAEVERLLAAGLSAQAPAMQAIGYREAVEVLQQHNDRGEFATALALAHRRYAKKQLTWFRAEPGVCEVEAADTDAVRGQLRAWFERGRTPA